MNKTAAQTETRISEAENPAYPDLRQLMRTHGIY